MVTAGQNAVARANAMRRRNEVRREEILAATVYQAGRLGMERLRVRDVAESLGISSGLVFYHFDT